MVKVKDTMGTMEVPDAAYYGASTQRAVENFPISGQEMPKEIIRALAQIKKAAAGVNRDLGLLPAELAEAIIGAAEEVIDGKMAGQFPVDVYQTGSGTSTNMNVNEVIAARANEILGHPRQGRSPVHPNDHVNMGQSSNDVIPSALHMAARTKARKNLVPAVVGLRDLLLEKAVRFADVVKVGRTHMQDAVPVTLGQEFSGWADQVTHSLESLRWSLARVEEVPLGGTAVGTGLNAHPEFASRVMAKLSELTGSSFREAENRFAAMGGKDGLVSLSGALSGYAVVLTKICSDLRFLASGPLSGIGEIRLPAVQPGSSIMPGKVNPVIIEATLQVCARVMGNNVTIGLAGASGNLELNVMMPLMGAVTMESIAILANATRGLTERCIRGIEAQPVRCRELVERSLALVTPLAAKIGYDAAAELAKEALERQRTIRDLVKEKAILSDEEIEEILDPGKMV